jgi:hypothetical protein
MVCFTGQVRKQKTAQSFRDMKRLNAEGGLFDGKSKIHGVKEDSGYLA